MKTLLVLSFVVIIINVASGQYDNPYNLTRKSLPKLSVMENIDDCLDDPNGVFYSINVELRADDTPLSQFIQNYALEKNTHYNFSHLHRDICGTRCGLNRTHTIFNETVITTLKECLNESIFNEYSLQVDTISIVFVKTNEEAPITAFDITVAAFIIFVVILNVGVTLYLYIFPRENHEGKSLIIAFSIENNWKQLANGSQGNANFFRCIEALRFYTNLFILSLHVSVYICGGFQQNVEYVEDVFLGYKKMLFNGRIVMQTFFVIGGFLMANKVFGMIENQKFSLKSIPMLSVNRYLRIMPALMTTVVLNATWIPKLGSGVLWGRFVKYEELMCKNNWWQLAIKCQNLFPFDKGCLAQTWYIGADWQLFHVSLLIILIVWKLPKHGTEILVGTSVISILTTFLQSYFLDLQPIRTSLNPDSFRNQCKGNDTLYYGYFSPQSNWGGYHIGVITAYLYRKAKKSNWDLKNSLILKTLYILSVPTILASFFVGSDFHHRKVSTFEAAIFNSINHNLFAAAVGIIILGSSLKMNSLYENFLEWGPLQPLGRLSYCSLLIHSGILRTYGGHQMAIYASDYNFTMIFAGVTCLTYLLSVPLYIFVEAPAYALQSMLLRPKNENDTLSNKIKSNIEILSSEKLTTVQGKITNGESVVSNKFVKLSSEIATLCNDEVVLSNKKDMLSNGEDALCNRILNGNKLSNRSVGKMARRINTEEVDNDGMTK